MGPDAEPVISMSPEYATNWLEEARLKAEKERRKNECLLMMHGVTISIYGWAEKTLLTH